MMNSLSRETPNTFNAPRDQTRIAVDSQQLPPQPPSRSCLININHPLRVKWDLFIMSLAAYNGFFIPLAMTFVPTAPDSVLYAIDRLLDFAFLLDILFNFRTTYINLMTGEEVSNGLLIARHYVLSLRFLIDLLSALPLSTIGEVLTDNSRTLELFSLLKLTRILRLNKIIFFLRTLEPVKLRIRSVHFILLLLMYLNAVACAWNVLVFRAQLWQPPMSLGDYYSLGVWEQYTFAFYSAVSMLLGMEVEPQCFNEVMFCSVTALVGAVVTAVLFGEMVVIIGNLNRTASKLYSTLNMANTTMRNLRLPRHLQDQISDYLVSTQCSLLRQKEFTKFRRVIPPVFLAELNTVLFNRLANSTPVFSMHRSATQWLIRRTSKLFCKPESDIVQQYSPSDSVYFVLGGVLEVLVQDLAGNVKRQRLLGSGTFFGEIGAIFGCHRTATVRASKYATIAKVEKEVFLSVLGRYPEMAEDLKLRAFSIYDDQLTKSLDSLLKHVHYIVNLSEMQYMGLLYSLKPESYVKGAVIIETGDSSNKVLFLTKGTVAVYFKTNGVLSYNTMLRLDENPVETPGVREIPQGARTAFEFYICSLHARSILCSKQALIKAPATIKVVAVTHCEFFVLPAEAIQCTARCTSDLLSANITVLKNKYCENSPEESARSSLILDFLQLNLPRKACFPFKTKLKFKHAVLKLIVKGRQKRSAGTISFFGIIQRLMTIGKGEGRVWKELQYKIESGTFPVEAIEIAKILNSTVTKNPIVKRMAKVAHDMQHYMWRTEYRLKRVQEHLGELEGEDYRLQNDIESLLSSYTTLEELIY